jgi:hypothetical protein
VLWQLPSVGVLNQSLWLLPQMMSFGSPAEKGNGSSMLPGSA